MKYFILLLCLLIMVPATAFAQIDVQGHRGARGLKPENTLPGFETALDLGVTTLEADLHFTSDEVVVIWHDDYIGSDKCGLDADVNVAAPDPDMLDEGDESLFISQLTFEQIQAYRCDRNPGGFSDQDNDPTPIAGDDYGVVSLEELFDFVDAYANSGAKDAGQRENAAQVQFNIETKRKPDIPLAINDGFDGENAGLFELAILALVEGRDLVDRVIIQSFDFRSLKAVRAENDSIRLAALTFGTSTPRFSEMLEFEAAIWSPYHEDLTPTILNRIRGTTGPLEGLQVMPWTVNGTCSMDRLITMGVDGIISDRPDVVLSVLSGDVADDSVSQNAEPLEPEAMIALRQRYTDEALVGGNRAVAEEVYACDVIVHWAPSAFPSPLGIDGYVTIAPDFTSSIENFEITVEVVFAEGEWLATREIWSGRLGTGDSFEIPYHFISRFNGEGKIAEEWVVWDTQAFNN